MYRNLLICFILISCGLFSPTVSNANNFNISTNVDKDHHNTTDSLEEKDIIEPDGLAGGGFVSCVQLGRTGTASCDLSLTSINYISEGHITLYFYKIANGTQSLVGKHTFNHYPEGSTRYFNDQVDRSFTLGSTYKVKAEGFLIDIYQKTTYVSSLMGNTWKMEK